MKVFISWSGVRSKQLAIALREWLPMVLQYVEPWVSDKDISAGERWAQAIAGELDAANFGIICITPENVNSEWILFESGALSKSMSDGKVIPFLFGLELSDLSGPISQFQAQKVDEGGVLEVVKSINKVAEKPTSSTIVDQLVPALWPRLQQSLEAIPEVAPKEKHKRSQNDILEELVTGVRNVNTRIRELEIDSSDREKFPRKRKRISLSAIDRAFSLLSEFGESHSILLLISSMLRDEAPWISDIMAETYREIRYGSPQQIEVGMRRLQRVLDAMGGDPSLSEAQGIGKETYAVIRELPAFLDYVFSRSLERELAIKPSRTRGEI